MTAPDPADVELIVKALHPYRFTTTGYQREAAIDVLTALAGRLLPNGGQARTEYGVEATVLAAALGVTALTPGIKRCGLGADCGSPELHTHTHTVTTYPDGTTVTTPWKEIGDGHA